MPARTIAVSVPTGVVIAALCLLLAQPAFAGELCLRSTIKAGKIVHKKTLVSDGEKCPRGYVSLLTTSQASQLGIQGLPGPGGATGATGPTGPTGLMGPIGPQGPAGGSTIQVVVAETPTDSNSPKFTGATCPVGTVLIGGGGGVVDGLYNPGPGPVAIAYSGPIPSPSPTWYVKAFETDAYASGWRVYSYAICQQAS